MSLQVALKRDDDGVIRADSIDVAKRFGKRHNDVLRACRDIECSPEFAARNFAHGYYVDANGQQRPMVRMTRDGFTMLAMGFTGAEAAVWKERYIEAFNLMERELVDGKDALTAQMTKLAELVESMGKASQAGNNLMISHVVETKNDVRVLRTDMENVKGRLFNFEQELAKRRRKITQSTKDQHYKVFVARGRRCPHCEKEVDVVQYDHFYASQHANFAHTWPICIPCHDELTRSLVNRTEAEASFRAYQRYAHSVLSRQMRLI